MKVLFVGDASNMHNCLAGQLRRQGHTAVVASGGSRWMNTGRDINLARNSGPWGTAQFVARLLRALPQMRGYDIVQLCSPIFLTLRPQRLRHVLSFLKRNNGKIVLSALGTDYIYYNACHDGNTFRYSDYLIGDKPSPYVNSSEYIAQQQDNWKSPMMRDYSNFVLSNIDGVVACLYEYYAAYSKLEGIPLAYADIPIDLSQLTFTEHDNLSKVHFFVGMQRDRFVVKGLDVLLASLKRVKELMPSEVEIDVVENLPYSEYVKRLGKAHVLIDQLYSYTPATNALLAMAQGVVAVSGAEPEYYKLIGETHNHPIVNVSPLDPTGIDSSFINLVKNRSTLPEQARQSREFVETHNDVRIVAQRYIDFWNNL